MFPTSGAPMMPFLNLYFALEMAMSVCQLSSWQPQYTFLWLRLRARTHVLCRLTFWKSILPPHFLSRPPSFVHEILPPAHLGCLSLFSQRGLLLACLVANECVRKCEAAAWAHTYVAGSEPTTEDTESPRWDFFHLYNFCMPSKKVLQYQEKKSVNVK